MNFEKRNLELIYKATQYAVANSPDEAETAEMAILCQDIHAVLIRGNDPDETALCECGKKGPMRFMHISDDMVHTCPECEQSYLLETIRAYRKTLKHITEPEDHKKMLGVLRQYLAKSVGLTMEDWFSGDEMDEQFGTTQELWNKIELEAL